MALRDPVGAWFSDLKDNWEKWTFFYDFSWEKDDRHNGVYRRCGDLPDGRSYGVYIFPKSMESPEISIVQIVDETGEMQHNVAAEHESWKVSQDHWPMAAVCGRLPLRKGISAFKR